MMGAEETKNFDFDSPGLMEKALSGTELHRKLLLLTVIRGNFGRISKILPN